MGWCRQWGHCFIWLQSPTQCYVGGQYIKAFLPGLIEWSCAQFDQVLLVNHYTKKKTKKNSRWCYERGGVRQWGWWGVFSSPRISPKALSGVAGVNGMLSSGAGERGRETRWRVPPRAMTSPSFLYVCHRLFMVGSWRCFPELFLVHGICSSRV